MFSSSFAKFDEETNFEDAIDDTMFNEGITASKIGFIVPLLHAIFFHSKEPAIDINLRIRVSGFLKDAISPSCILVRDFFFISKLGEMKFLIV